MFNLHITITAFKNDKVLQEALKMSQTSDNCNKLKHCTIL